MHGETMVGICEETSSQLHLLADAYIELMKDNPDKELLKLAKLHDDRNGFDWTPEYYDQFVEDTDTHRIQGFIRYTEALKDAFLHGGPLKEPIYT